MLTQAIDYRDECDSLYELLVSAEEGAWRAPTQFKGWTLEDILGHLHLFDTAAKLTLEGPTAFPLFSRTIAAGRAGGRTLLDYTRSWLGPCRGRELLERWHAFSRELADCYVDLDPAQRVAWAGPEMSVRSCISARQMETWAHGQAAFDLLGRVRLEHDRIRNIVIMGLNTFGWTFANRGFAVPERKPYVRLLSPSGAHWEWGDPQREELIEGSAVEFCQVVTQTRNVADTKLTVIGPVAQRWMAIAQCFAGRPEDPPAPGSRFAQAQ